MPERVVRQRNFRIYLERLEKYLDSSFYAQANLRGKIYTKRCELTGMKVAKTPNKERIPVKDVLDERNPKNLKWKDGGVGKQYGPSWSTFWFKIKIKIPSSDYNNKTVHLLWNGNNEGMLYNTEGHPLQGFTGGNGRDKRWEYEITTNAQEGQEFEYYMEMACNGMFGVGKGNDIAPPDPTKYFLLEKAEIAIYNHDAYSTCLDIKILAEIAKELGEESQRGCQALKVANDIVTMLSMDDRRTWKEAHKIAMEFFGEKNGEAQHQVHAVSHCHIDVAWLWPYDETKRKTARSFATQIQYMDKYDFHTYAQSNALLYDWMKELYPSLYEKMKEKVKEGKLLPVGGTWVEFCGNLPSGESFIRQFLYGQRFFESEFGQKCNVFFLPDSFGFSANLPQIMKGCAIERFVSQKISWNLINKFPFSTFHWKGLDGTTVLTHFPPADTYVHQVTVPEFNFQIKNFRDKDRSSTSLTLHGNGDGGGGATIEMLERLDRLQDCFGLPVIKPSTVDKFFDAIEKEDEEVGFLEWDDELYLEFHRGIYTSQASTKKGNRKGEYLLREIEYWGTLAKHVNPNYHYPQEKLDELWKLLMINQFHDVLPGTSIGMVFDDALKYYKQIQQVGSELLLKAQQEFIQYDTQGNTLFNSLSFDREEIIRINDENVLVRVPAGGVVPLNDVIIEYSKYGACNLKETKETFEVSNDFITLTVHKKDGVMDLYDKRNDRLIITGGNQFQLFTDQPLFWQAWDVELYHEETVRSPKNVVGIEVVENHKNTVVLAMVINLTDTSVVHQTIHVYTHTPRIDFKTKIKWKDEAHTMLKVAFNTTIRSKRATYEVQYGHLERPTMRNTSWDMAKFEVLGHKWCDFSQYGSGVALLNDCKYGYAVHKNVMSLSLLRSPKAPDDQCDMGTHRFTYALLPHDGNFQKAGVIQQAYQLNIPCYCARGIPKLPRTAGIRSTNHAIVAEVLKEGSVNSMIARVYESFGSSAIGHITIGPCLKKPVNIYYCNMLEEICTDDAYESTVKHVDFTEDGFINFQVSLSPFKIQTFKLIFEDH